MMKKLATGFVVLVMLCAFLFTGACSEPAEAVADTVFTYRFASPEEAGRLLLANRQYYENLTRNDLNFRMQKLGATLEELEAFTREQMLEFTDAEKAAVDDAMAAIEAACAERGYHLPVTGGIVFSKTTMAEEGGAGAYTHGTEIYLGSLLMSYALADNPDYVMFFREVVAHELFHCLTRNNPEFRTAMYGILGFTVVEEDYTFAPEIREKIISNPDVEHHNAYAAFDIGGEMKDCVVVFTTREPFRKPGDLFLVEENMLAGLVPVDDTGVLYTADEAANFWDVFGLNTGYVIDPEETLADNFKLAILYGPDGLEYQTPEIIEAIDAYLKGH